MTPGTVNHFSSESREYSYARPKYPEDLFKFLNEITPVKDLAWDCATGNGQAAISLCKYFKKVIASDASKNQIDNAFDRDNINYEVFPAEKPNIQNSSVNLITVAMAVHWFDFEKFYREARRVSRSSGRIALWAYGMQKISPEIDKISERLNVGGDILGNYWSKEVKFVKEEYKTIPFPFKEIDVPKFEIKVYWDLNNLFDYMQTWSAVKRFYAENRYDPLSLVKEDLKNLWGKDDEIKLVKWDLNLRVGCIDS
jgi:SAM-dependent methyltransferase